MPDTSNRKLDPGVPTPGSLAPLFRLRAPDGRLVRLSDLRQRFHLLLVFTRVRATRPYLELVLELDRQAQELRQWDTRLIWVVPSGAQLAGFEPGTATDVLEDATGEVLTRYLGEEEAAAAGVYVVDRYGEIIAAELDRSGSAPPAAETLLEAVRHADLQCPE